MPTAAPNVTLRFRPIAHRRETVAAAARRPGDPRMTCRTTAFLVALMLSGTIAHAAPPQINGITPFGVKRGEPSEVTINGANLGGNPKAGRAVQVRGRPARAGDGGNWKPKLNVDPHTPVGVYPIRVWTDEGTLEPVFVRGRPTAASD